MHSCTSLTEKGFHPYACADPENPCVAKGPRMRIYMRVLVMKLAFFATSLVIQTQSSPAPRVWAITLNDNATTTKRTTFIVTFSEAVSGVDTSDFRVFSSGKTAIV